MKKHQFSMLISGVVILTLILSACTPKTTPTTAATEKPAATEVPAVVEAPTQKPTEKVAEATPTSAVVAEKVNPAGEFPIVNEKITLKVMIPQQVEVSDYVNNDFTKWLEEKTNIHLEFDVAADQEKLNLVLASGELPDVIIGFGIPMPQLQVLADQKLIIPLDDLIEKYAVEFKTVMKDFPEMKETLSLADGKLYSMPHVVVCYHCQTAQKAWIYKPWLDKLGLAVPTTTDELYTALKAFKTQDPNGNGKADEIPWSGAATGSWLAQLDSFIMNSFVMNSRLSNDLHMYLENGVIKAAFAEPGWKEGIIYLNKLYQEGLIDPEIFTNDITQIRGLGESADVPVLGFTQTHWPGSFTDWMGPSGRSQEYVPIPPLKGPSGLIQTPKNPYQPLSSGHYTISAKCKYPEAAFRLVDFMYNYEATMRTEFGRPGIEWAEVNNTESIAGGMTARYKVLVPWTQQPKATTWNKINPVYISVDQMLVWAEFTPVDPLERLLYQTTLNLYTPYAKPEMMIPPLTFTSEQSKQLGELNTVLYGMVDQMFASFVIGEQDINTGWDQYLSDLKSSGLDKYLQLYQEAYDLKFKK